MGAEGEGADALPTGRGVVESARFREGGVCGGRQYAALDVGGSTRAVGDERVFGSDEGGPSQVKAGEGADCGGAAGVGMLDGVEDCTSER